jgi:hypothetical protein
MDIPTLANSTWTAIQPFLPIIATKGAEELGKRAVGEVWDLVKKKFEKDPKSEKLVKKLVENPQDNKVQGAFQYQLEELLEEDATFADQLEKLLASAGSDYKAQVIGDGAIAQGTGAKAVGKGGVIVDGNVTGNIVTGNNNKINHK